MRKQIPHTFNYPCLLLLLSITFMTGCGNQGTYGYQPTQQPVEEPITGAPNPIVQLDVTQSVTLVEGEGQAVIPVSVTRASGSDDSITLSARGANTADEQQLSWRFEQGLLQADESSTNLIVQMGIGPRPIQSQIRTLLISASDGVSETISTPLSISIQPTDKPDIYLLVGQSNAVGYSEQGAKRSQPGQADAPNERIHQLNVTANDATKYTSPAEFTSAANLYDIAEPLTAALDPLHDEYQTDATTKSGQRIGFGLSFAKKALPDTTAQIYLVPAAAADTGFCIRVTNPFPSTGWNATDKNNPALSGTLLHDRAIARANSALNLTDGILRGILWHQGEADSEDISCATAYEDNLVELANSLRMNIAPDARGPEARSASSDIPFIVGTMSKGGDSRGNLLPFSEAKLIVDAAHRNVATSIPMSGFVNSDDLVPPAYSCGTGGCIHFGAESLREMGARYYDTLVSLLTQN